MVRRLGQLHPDDDDQQVFDPRQHDQLSDHSFPLADPRPIPAIVQACHDADRGPATVTWDGTTLTLGFSTNLSAGEQAALAEIVRAAETPLSRAERNAIQSDIDGLVTYQNLATPTLAQTVLAVKAQSRILRAILRS